MEQGVFVVTDKQIWDVFDGGTADKRAKDTERGVIEPQPARNKGMKGHGQTLESSCFQP